jgi:hypothetical protein
MKRLWLYIIGVILLAGAVVAVVLAVNDAKDDKSKSTSSSDLAVSLNSKKACSIFTLADANQVLNNAARGGVSPPESSSDDLAVSECVYAQSAGPSAPVSSTKSAILLVRAPKTEAGSQSNNDQFHDLRPSVTQDVGGYGDSAYWDPQHGQLDILKHNTWYILSNGPITPSARTLDEAKQLADLLIDKM